VSLHGLLIKHPVWSDHSLGRPPGSR
jgi:hypothetical protein